MTDDLVNQLKKADTKVKLTAIVEPKVEPVKTNEPSIVDYITSGDMDKAKEAIQREVVRCVTGEVSKK